MLRCRRAWLQIVVDRGRPHLAPRSPRRTLPPSPPSPVPCEKRIKRARVADVAFVDRAADEANTDHL